MIQGLRTSVLSPWLDPAISHESLVLVILGGVLMVFDQFLEISWGFWSLLGRNIGKITLLTCSQSGQENGQNKSKQY